MTQMRCIFGFYTDLESTLALIPAPSPQSTNYDSALCLYVVKAEGCGGNLVVQHILM